MGTCTSKITPEEPHESMIGSGFYPNQMSLRDTLIHLYGSASASASASSGSSSQGKGMGRVNHLIS